MLCCIKENPGEYYYETLSENRDLACSCNDIKSYFDKIDFVEGFA